MIKMQFISWQIYCRQSFGCTHEDVVELKILLLKLRAILNWVSGHCNKTNKYQANFTNKTFSQRHWPVKIKYIFIPKVLTDKTYIALLVLF